MALTKHERLSVKIGISGTLAIVTVTILALTAAASPETSGGEAFERWVWACMLIVLFTALLAVIPLLIEDQKDFMRHERRYRANRRT